jgi:hypothetical protein
MGKLGVELCTIGLMLATCVGFFVIIGEFQAVVAWSSRSRGGLTIQMTTDSSLALSYEQKSMIKLIVTLTVFEIFHIKEASLSFAYCS